MPRRLRLGNAARGSLLWQLGWGWAASWCGLLCTCIACRRFGAGRAGQGSAGQGTVDCCHGGAGSRGLLPSREAGGWVLWLHDVGGKRVAVAPQPCRQAARLAN
jgi:hypothetical protein